MTSLNLKRAFDLVICPFFTLAHVPAGADWTIGVRAVAMLKRVSLSPADPGSGSTPRSRTPPRRSRTPWNA